MHLHGICWPCERALERELQAENEAGRCCSPFYHDGTERPITRPHDDAEQKAHYSGKKKRHNVKNVLLGDQSCQVPFLSDTYEGSRHDKPIADQTPYPLPEGSELLQDLALLALRSMVSQITMPHKKPRGGELTAEQKAENRVIAHRRVRVEHIICSIKRLRIVKDTCGCGRTPYVIC